jgi:hypothetical protein
MHFNLHFFDHKNRSHLKKEGYVSEFTQFIDHFLEEHPEAVQSQKDGWHIYWDKDVDFDELRKSSKETVPIKGYDYF